MMAITAYLGPMIAVSAPHTFWRSFRVLFAHAVQRHPGQLRNGCACYVARDDDFAARAVPATL